MSQALREDEIGNAEPSGPAIKLHAAERYTPDLTAYERDPGNDKQARLKEIADAGKLQIRLMIGAADGRREQFDLNESESKAYIEGELVDREATVNRRILERRLSVARDAARRLSEGRKINPDQEACLREFAGYTRTTKRIREQDVTVETLREGFADRADRALAELKLGHLDALREDDWFGGDSGDFGAAPSGLHRSWVDRDYLPGYGSPAYRQQQITDVWDTVAKAAYAATHDPVIREGHAILTEFPLGRGIRLVAKDTDLQPQLDDFWNRNKLRRRIRRWANSLSRFGNLYIRSIHNADGTTDTVSLPAETIDEIVHDGDNAQRVFYYVQRYTTGFQNQVGAPIPEAGVRCIVRIIPADEIVHIKINAGDEDLRGWPDSFPALGWAKRLRDYADAEVQKSRAMAAYQWILQHQGTAADGVALQAQIPAGPPEPGSTWVINGKVDVKAAASGASAVAGNGSTYELLLNQIALAFGVPKDYFGVSSRGSRATALVAADPAAKRFEDRQDVIDELVTQIVDDALAWAVLRGKIAADADLAYRTVFPTIVKADAKTRAGLLRTALAAGSLSHQTMSQEMAGEIDLEGYDYDAEQEQIMDEIGVKGSDLCANDVYSVRRGLPSVSDPAFDPGEVPNAPADTAGNAPAEPPNDGATPLSAAGAADIRKKVGAQEQQRRRVLAEAAAAISAAGGIAVLP